MDNSNSRERSKRNRIRWCSSSYLQYTIAATILLLDATYIVVDISNGHLTNFTSSSQHLEASLREFLNGTLTISSDLSQNQLPPKSHARRKLQTILDDNFRQTGSLLPKRASSLSSNTNGLSTMTNETFANLWDYSEIIPDWMKEYFEWHRQQRKQVTEANWKEHRWLVMQCMKGLQEKCGGLADRLKPFVYMLRQAYEFKRILIIYWNQPMELEEFLVPPEGGIDWRTPRWMLPALNTIDLEGVPYVLVDRVKYLDRFGPKPLPLVRTRFQSITGEQSSYEEKVGLANPDNIEGTNITNTTIKTNEPSFQDVYHDVWRIFFTPTKSIAEKITEEMNRMELVPGEYVAAHLRAMYGRIVHRPKSEAIEWTQNALNCASNLRPGGPIFFASDLNYATKAALKYNDIVKKRHGSSTRIVARLPSAEPLHFEKMEMSPLHEKKNVTLLQSNDLHDVFVDLYLMGMGNGVTFNRGGFGQWALLIGFNATDGGHKQKTSQAGIGVRCNWSEPAISSNLASEAEKYKPRTLSPLFLEPMSD